MIDLTLLGCGGNMPMPNRYLSSLFINYRGKKILVDCGESTQVAMRINKCGFKDIDLICITHLHGDHLFGLVGLLSTMGNSGKTNTLNIIGPIGIVDVMNSFKIFLEYIPFDINIIENPKDTFCIDSDVLRDIEISTIDLDHSTECIGYSLYIKRKPKFDINKATINNVPKFLWQKLQEGNDIVSHGITYTSDMVLGNDRKGLKISYITDTRPTNDIPKFIENSDLFICEGMYGDDLDISKAFNNKHMTFRESANLAALGNVEKLLLTHFSPALLNPSDYLENATNIFENTVIGYDGYKETLIFKD